METFKLQSYTKAELAQLYSPHSEGPAALQTLYRWMRRNEPLMAELEAMGYNKYRHSFLKQEVGIIVKYLGEPRKHHHLFQKDRHLFQKDNGLLFFT